MQSAASGTFKRGGSAVAGNRGCRHSTEAETGWRRMQKQGVVARGYLVGSGTARMPTQSLGCSNSTPSPASAVLHLCAGFPADGVDQSVAL
eukprot:12926726-Prorocentrum_lima.AAC.1